MLLSFFSRCSLVHKFVLWQTRCFLLNSITWEILSLMGKSNHRHCQTMICLLNSRCSSTRFLHQFKCHWLSKNFPVKKGWIYAAMLRSLIENGAKTILLVVTTLNCLLVPRPDFSAQRFFIFSYFLTASFRAHVNVVSLLTYLLTTRALFQKLGQS